MIIRNSLLAKLVRASVFVPILVPILVLCYCPLQIMASQGDPIRIGVTMRILSDFDLKQSEIIQEEFSKINASGGIKGSKIELVILNDECNVAKGVRNTRNLIRQEKVHIVIGSSCSSVTLSMLKVSAQGKTPQITPYATDTRITQRGSAWIFRVPVSDRFYIVAQSEYLATEVGKKIAYIYARDTASSRFARGMISYMRSAYQVEPAFAVRIKASKVDYASILKLAKASNPTALVISAPIEQISETILASYEAGIEKQVIRVLPPWAIDEELPELAGDSINGAIYAGSFSSGDKRKHVKKIASRVESDYNASLRQGLAQTWDTIRIVVQALEVAKFRGGYRNLAYDRQVIRDALAKTKNYQGLGAGAINFCASATPRCRDGSSTPVLIRYINGGKAYKTKLFFSKTLKLGAGL